ncbi:MAG: hypothetical protein WCO08_01230 [Actinomycetes bacterium]
MTTGSALALIISIVMVLAVVFLINRGSRKLREAKIRTSDARPSKYDRHHRSAWASLNEGEDPTL